MIKSLVIPPIFFFNGCNEKNHGIDNSHETDLTSDKVPVYTYKNPYQENWHE
jgi:hypothetical protein